MPPSTSSFAGSGRHPARRCLLLLSAASCATSFVPASRAAPAAAPSLRAGGTGSALATVQQLGTRFAARHAGAPRLTIAPNLGSAGGLRALRAGAIDLAIISRSLNTGEAAAGLKAVEYGRTPMIFATSKSNAAGLDLAQVPELLATAAAKWPDGAALRFILRPRNDTDAALLAALSPDVARAHLAAQERPGMVVAATDQDAADEAERLAGSLVFCGLSLLLAEKRRLRVLALDGVLPSPATLASGQYPHFKPMLFVTRGTPAGAAAAFIEFVKSPAARGLLEETGHAVLS